MGRVIVNANAYPDDGGLEMAEIHLKMGDGVVIENMRYEQDAERCENLAARFDVTISFIWIGPGSPKCIFAKK